MPYIDSQTSALSSLLAGDVDLLNDEEYWDPHAVAGLLKTYFRELPTTILTHERHFRFLKVIGTLSSLTTLHSRY